MVLPQRRALEQLQVQAWQQQRVQLQPLQVCVCWLQVAQLLCVRALQWGWPEQLLPHWVLQV